MSPAVRWILLSLIALAAILVPFLLYEDTITTWVKASVHEEQSRGYIAGAICALLASDVLLPIPSSLVATASGYLLGVGPGAAVSWAGMTAGGLIGYLLGSRPARHFTRRFVGDAELARASSVFERWGEWAIVVCRSVPVLAEASVVFAGVAGMPLPKFLLLSGLSNLAIALAYASVGSFALRANSFLMAFTGAIVLPAIAMALLRKRG